MSVLFILGKPLWFPPGDGKRVSLLSAELPHKLSESPQAGGGSSDTSGETTDDS